MFRSTSMLNVQPLQSLWCPNWASLVHRLSKQQLLSPNPFQTVLIPRLSCHWSHIFQKTGFLTISTHIKGILSSPGKLNYRKEIFIMILRFLFFSWLILSNVWVRFPIRSPSVEWFLMCTHNIHFHGETRGNNPVTKMKPLATGSKSNTRVHNLLQLLKLLYKEVKAENRIKLS